MAIPPSNNNNRATGAGNSQGINNRSTSRHGASGGSQNIDVQRVIEQNRRTQPASTSSASLRGRLSVFPPNTQPPSYEEACAGNTNELPPSYAEACGDFPPSYSEACEDLPPPYSEPCSGFPPTREAAGAGSRRSGSSSHSAGSRGGGRSSGSPTLAPIYEAQGARPRVRNEGRSSSGRTQQAAQRVLPRPLPSSSPEPSTLPIPYHRALQSVRYISRTQPPSPPVPSELHVLSSALGHRSWRQEVLVTANAASRSLFLRSNAFTWGALIEILIQKAQKQVVVRGRYNPEAGAPPPLPQIPYLDVRPYYQNPRAPVRQHYQHVLLRDGNSALIFCGDFSNNSSEGLDLTLKINSSDFGRLVETRVQGTVKIQGQEIRYLPLNPNSQEGTQTIVQAINQAQTSIWICNNNINDPDILCALKQAHLRDVNVIVIVGPSDDLPILYDQAALASADYVTCVSNRPINTNFALIDKKLFMAGSAPWTMQGLESSYSDLVIVTSPSVPNCICLQNFWSLLSDSVEVLDPQSAQEKINLALQALSDNDPENGATGGEESPHFALESYLEFCTQTGQDPDLYRSEGDLSQEMSNLSLTEDS
ncbi:MAG: phospholipase D-like domain-containing protein [Chlamydia suis]|nr:phospholipase D-like domain-containing protein [Chlamydia suis]